MEKTGELLGRVDRIFSNLSSANTNPTLQKIETEMAPKLSAQQDAIYLNGPLFKRIETLYNNRAKLGLDAESTWLVERYYKDFVRAGAQLSDADKTTLKKMNAELAELQTKFSQNVLKEKNAELNRGREARRSWTVSHRPNSPPQPPPRRKKRRKASLSFPSRTRRSSRP